MNLDGGDNFFEGAENFGEAGWGDEKIGAGGEHGRNLDDEFIAGSGGEAGVVASDRDGLVRDGAAIAPVEWNSLKGGFVSGAGPVGVGRGDEGTARGGGGGRVHDELEMAGGEGGVGIGVVGNTKCGDEDGAGLPGFPVVLGQEAGGGAGVEFFIEDVVAGVAEGDAEVGIVVKGEATFVGRLLGNRMRRECGNSRLGCGGRVACGGEAGLGGVASGEPAGAQQKS